MYNGFDGFGCPLALEALEELFIEPAYECFLSNVCIFY